MSELPLYTPKGRDEGVSVLKSGREEDVSVLQGYLAHKNPPPPPQDHRRALGIGLL